MIKFKKLAIAGFIVGASLLAPTQQQVKASVVDQPQETVNQQSEELNEQIPAIEEDTNYISIEEFREKFNSEGIDFSQPCGLSREDFIQLIEEMTFRGDHEILDHSGFFCRNAGVIWDMEQKWNVNAVGVCGLFALESHWSEHQCGLNNYSGMTVPGKECFQDFESEEDNIEYTIRNLAQYYVAYDRTTPWSIGAKYCESDSSWGDQVQGTISMIVNPN